MVVDGNGREKGKAQPGNIADGVEYVKRILFCFLQNIYTVAVGRLITPGY